ncbi:TPA: ATP-binding protein [Burkholderia vietnamiensis]|nr:ATP-binding protein [Burkholderia vietnamiensis]HDR8975900.1 ATP-binding protein [Burkholderia vietnamiensis]HDR9066205.1 ATP-binding protein [Burkholderia vietnamiensis]
MLEVRKVYVASESAAQDGLVEGDILIYPSTDRWNDFGYQTYCEFLIVGTDFVKKFRLAFVEGPEIVSAMISKGLNGSTGPVEISSFPPFFSMQIDMDQYRDVVDSWGASTAKALLRALHDVVTVQALEPSTPWLRDALQSPHFQMSFIRSSDSNFAFHNAASLLSGVEFENINAAPSTLALNFQIEGFASPHRFEFTFSACSSPPKRIAVVIGKNGVGKSRTLNQLICSAMGQPAGEFHDGEGVMPRLSRIVAVCTPGEAETTFPDEPPVPQSYVYKRISAAPSDELHTLPQVLVTLSRDMRRIGAHWRWSIFAESVRQVLDIDELVVDTKGGGIGTGGELSLRRLWEGGEQASAEARMRVNPTGKLRRNVKGNSVPLSSGQQSFVRLAAQLCTYVENGSLVLMDEPETHLHPNLITGLVAMLDRMLSLTGSIAIVATHSAYLVREVPHSQVHIIRQDDVNQTIEISKPRLRTFGADVGSISHFVFGDDIVNRLISHLEESLDEDAGVAEKWLASIEGELSTEAIMALRREIEKRREQKQ